jgi:hypothetical protein
MKADANHRLWLKHGLSRDEVQPPRAHDARNAVRGVRFTRRGAPSVVWGSPVFRKRRPVSTFSRRDGGV